MKPAIKLTECPRDAMQGWKHFIPTVEKINYLNLLLKVGFDVLDFGSFVSPKAIPQLADTKEVIAKLNLTKTKSKLLAIIANCRGAEEAVMYDEIAFLGFPFSISQTFQLKNTNKTIEQSLEEVLGIQNLCVKKNKELVIYISMGFGNPYNDEYSPEIALRWVKKLAELGIKTFAVADTVGLADTGTVSHVYKHLTAEFKNLTIGAHFHSTILNWEEKIDAAWVNGCTNFDSAFKGIGGCPMADNELVGNIATENLVSWCDRKGIELQLDRIAYDEALLYASRLFI